MGHSEGERHVADEVGWMTDSPHHGAFGNDRFGVLAERFARFFGTPRFIVGQTALVALWILLNAAAVSLRWDPYPFILLNLAFSTQAAYAAPLILLAQTRQADRDKIRDATVQAHREKEAAKQAAFEKHETAVLAKEQEMATTLQSMLEKNTALTEQVATLTEQLHATICKPG
jgi:uncharacterized membrane protein